MSSELIPHLLRAALFASLAILAVLVLRRPLQRWLGPALAYQAWLLVPLVVAASMLPARSSTALQSVQVLRPVQALTVQATTPATPAQADTLWLVWAAGAAAVALRLFLAQRAFRRQEKAGDAGPASTGLLRPRVVLPRDFAARYSLAEQALVLAHERAHIARGDLVANLLAALFQCVFWFNPLVHLGARRFRQDQELACDADVMRRHPGQRRSYAEALLKSHTGAVAATGIHCHWQHPHPTKERIMQLQHTPPGTFRRLVGRCTLVLLALGAFGATLGARAQQPVSAPRYSVALAIAEAVGPVEFKLMSDDLVNGGKGQLPSVITPAGEKFSISSGEWRLDMVIDPAEQPDQVWMRGKLFKGEVLVTSPTMRSQLGQRASLRIGDHDKGFGMAMVVTRLP